MFQVRHIGPTKKEVKAMLEGIEVSSVDELMNQSIPKAIRLEKEINLAEGISENNCLRKIQHLGDQNKCYTSYIGMGYHPAVLPAVIQRNILENPSWYTAYTPYQAEISQGRLEALFNYQSMVIDLTGMEIANASLLDEGTAAAEGMSLLFANRTREQKKKSFKFFVSEKVLLQTQQIIRTRAEHLAIELVFGDESNFTFSTDFFGGLFAYQSLEGELIDLKSLIPQLQELDIKSVVTTDLLALTLLEAPEIFGVDVVVGSSQRFGIPLGYGGPHAAFFATREKYKRSVPGRIIGKSIDVHGNDAYRMALQTREQHIKRDKATSNICTAQVLLAVMASMYGVYHGADGLTRIATRIHEKTKKLGSILAELGIDVLHHTFFDTLCIKVNQSMLKEIAERSQINLGYLENEKVVISLNEVMNEEDFDKLIHVFEEYAGKKTTKQDENVLGNIPSSIERKTTFLTHPIFNSHRTETSLMRYIKGLEKKDISLTHSMIALGSCTMKLNAAVQLLPLSMSNWNSIHPFAPENQTLGYKEMLNNLCSQLIEITGFSGASLQPNSGAQGEFAGLLAIKSYLQSIGEGHRNICLIPASAHGTNPASAVMTGMKVVIIKTDEKGNIQLEDLKKQAIDHKENLAALMVTYPSTHGVFEEHIKEITALIHQNGGQVYMDGANMNAQVGLTNPAIIGADVCHLNLHKTFAIPHGGGGPGVGAICVAEHLVPFLPKHFFLTDEAESLNTVSAAPWGSALVCLISYSYILMLGKTGLRKATEIAILNANYMKSKLEKHFNILYANEKGRIAHEFILDLRKYRTKGITVSDVAKRLMDYGYHAPTVSFPVADTMMIEPTESENKEELDRFCDALICIKAEIEQLEKHSLENSLLKNAPHTLKSIVTSNWTKPYTREQAAFPLEYVEANKYWPSVGRVDDAFGDRNLICSCAPIE